MDIEKLFFLPEWNDRFLREEGEEWKTNDSLNAAKALYNQWGQVFRLAVVFIDTLADDEEKSMAEKLIYENIMIVAPKIMSAAGDTLYIIKMENAAIIRTNCRQLMEQVGFAALAGMADEQHKRVIEEAMEKFQALFKEWVITFKKDDCDDPWGLFV